MSMSTKKKVKIMWTNERGSTLMQVLLVITVFSVIGLAVLSSVVGESKRVEKTESNVQVRNLAADGLIYFEDQFKTIINQNKPLSWEVLKTKVETTPAFQGQPIPNVDGEVTLNVKLPNRDDVKNKDIVEVISHGKNDSGEDEKIIGYYKLDFHHKTDAPRVISTFGPEGEMVNFQDGSGSILTTELLNLIDIGLVETTWFDNKYYPVPQDASPGVGLNLLFNVLGIKLDVVGLLTGLLDPFDFIKDNKFQYMEKKPVIATREGSVLGAELLKVKNKDLLSVSLIDFQDKADTNVIINGFYDTISVKLLGVLPIDIYAGYQDINFYKLGVMGNVVIQQTRKSLNSENGISIWVDNKIPRSFYFKYGLYVNNSLVIGGIQGIGNDKEPAMNLKDYSRLKLDSDVGIAVMDNLVIQDADLDINTNLYVDGKTKIKNSCINQNKERSNFHLYSKRIVLESNPNCNKFDGYFYGEDGITIMVNDNRDMIINGELIGNVTIKRKSGATGKVIFNSRSYNDVKYNNINLVPQARSFDKS